MATLTIDLDDEATEGLVALNDQLEQTAAVTDTVADAAANLSEVQQQQLVVINKSTAGWSQLADTSINAFGKIAGAGLHAFGSITSAAMRAADAANLLEHSADVGKAVAYFAASKAGWDSVEKAAGVAGTTIAKRVLGLGPQFLGATIALEAYSAVLARTGLKTVELADGTTILESNLDRVNAAASRFGSDVSRDFKEAADAAATLIDIVNPFPDIWKEIDKVATKSAENLVDNIGLVRQGYNDSVISLRAFAVEMQGGSGEAYKKEIESLRELSEWHAKMDQQRANEISHFDRLRDANAATEARAAARGEAERIASFKSTAAIDAEIQKMKDKAGQQAAALKFDEAAQTAFNSTMIALEQRRQAVEKETSAKRSENYKKATEEYTEQMRQADDMIARHREIYDLETKRLQIKDRQNKELVGTQKNQDFQTGLDAAKDLHAGEKEIAEARMKAAGATDAAIREQLNKMDREFSEGVHALKMQQIAEESKVKRAELESERLKLEKSGIDGAEREKRLSAIKAEEDKMNFERRKKGIEEEARFQREQNKLTIDDQRAREMDKLKAIADAHAKNKKMLGIGAAGGAGGGGAGAGNQHAAEILGAQDKKQVLKALQEERQQKASMEQAIKDEELAIKALAGNKAAAKKFESNQKAAMARAKRYAREDFQNGDVEAGELTRSQNQVAQKTIATLQKQGKMSGDQAKAMQDMLQAQADASTAVDNLQATVEQLVATAKGQKQISRRQAEAARNQANSLD